jgi:hypothetical protein
VFWRRGQEVQPAVVAWRAGREQLQEVLVREAVPAALGPHRGDWTAVRLLVHGDEAVEPRHRDVVDLVDDLARTLQVPGAACMVGPEGARLLVVCTGVEAPLTAELPSLPSGRPLVRPEWAVALQAISAGGRLEAVMAAAEGTAGGGKGRAERLAAAMQDRRPWRVAEAAGLPPQLFDPDLLGDPYPVREAVFAPSADRSDPEVVCSAVGLPLQEAWFGRGVLLTAAPPDATVLLPVAAGLGAGRRRPALVLWRQGDARGYQLCIRGQVEDQHVWSSDWQVVPLEGNLDVDVRQELLEVLEPAHGNADVLLDRLGVTEADPAELRALLRRPPDPDVLKRLCALLGLPAEAAEVVEGADPADLPGSRPVRVSSTSRAILRAATQPQPGDPWFVRAGYEKPWWYRAANLLWVPVALGWALTLWDGGTAAKAGAAAVAASAVVSLVSALRPTRTNTSRRTASPGD